MTGLRVLVVDDEPQILRFLRPALEASGYQVLNAAVGREALRLIANSAPDIVVLDLCLPDMNGKEVLAEARKFTMAPILVLSACDSEVEKIAALDLGADDYVEKPFAIGELLARLRAALRHCSGSEVAPVCIEVDGLAIDMDKRRVTRNGAPKKLTPKEYDLLCLLARHAGRVVTHRQILTAVWGPAHKDDTQYLRTFVRQLRGKVENDPAAPTIIENEVSVTDSRRTRGTQHSASALSDQSWLVCVWRGISEPKPRVTDQAMTAPFRRGRRSAFVCRFRD